MKSSITQMMTMALLLAVVLVTLGFQVVAADDSGYTGEWWLTPPPPPNAGNADGWTLDTYEFELGVNMPTYKNVDSGPSWHEVQVAQLQIDWTGEQVWQWT